MMKVQQIIQSADLKTKNPNLIWILQKQNNDKWGLKLRLANCNTNRGYLQPPTCNLSTNQITCFDF